MADVDPEYIVNPLAENRIQGNIYRGRAFCLLAAAPHGLALEPTVSHSIGRYF